MKSQIISIQWIMQLSHPKANDTTGACMVQGVRILTWRFFLIDVFPSVTPNRSLNKDRLDPVRSDKGSTHFRELANTCVSSAFFCVT